MITKRKIEDEILSLEMSKLYFNMVRYSPESHEIKFDGGDKVKNQNELDRLKQLYKKVGGKLDLSDASARYQENADIVIDKKKHRIMRREAGAFYLYHCKCGDQILNPVDGDGENHERGL